MRFTQTQAARLLGLRGHSHISRLEDGIMLPNISTLFKLSILYRVPAEFLYKEMHSELLEDLRAKEERTRSGQRSASLRSA